MAHAFSFRHYFAFVVKRFHPIDFSGDVRLCFKKGVKYPRYRSRGVQEVKAPRFHDTLHTKVVRSLPLPTGRLYPQEYPGTHF